MSNGRIKRNWFPLIISIITMALTLVLKITPHKIPNYNEIFSGILSLSSMATAFLFASFTLIPALPDSQLMKALKQMHTDKKLLDRLLITTFSFVLVSIFSIIMFLFDKQSDSCVATLFITLTFGFLMFSNLNLLKVLRILMRALEYF